MIEDRLIEKYVEGEWVEVPILGLKEGNIIRVAKTYTYMVVENAVLNDWGSPSVSVVECEEVK